MRTLDQYKPTDLFRYQVAHREVPWLSVHPLSGKVIIVVDNHLLSTYRACASFFMLCHVDGQQPKPRAGQAPERKPWFLEFGIVFHVMIEHYYKHFRDENFSVVKWASELAYSVWTKHDMDYFKGRHPEYDTIGGLVGFQAMLIAYAHRFTPENEKLRVIGTEVAFGKNKEIPLYIGPTVEIYLAGRMDVIVDDGYFIMPMDHKTCGTLKRDPLERYLTDEGPTGYVYALHKILPKMVSPETIIKRDCNRILMNFISKQFDQKAPLDRFKRQIILKSEEALEMYQLRMIATVQDLLENLERHFNNFPIPRDTQHCTDWYHAKCMYYDVHRQNSREGEQATLQNGFTILPIWDTETVGTLN